MLCCKINVIARVLRNAVRPSLHDFALVLTMTQDSRLSARVSETEIQSTVTCPPNRRVSWLSLNSKTLTQGVGEI
jgi:hypothetical protein